MQDLVTTLYNWLAISDEPQKADLIFLFGAPTLAVPQRRSDSTDSRMR